MLGASVGVDFEGDGDHLSGDSCTIPSIMTILRNVEANGFSEPEGPKIIRLFPVSRVPRTTPRIAKSAVRLILVFSALLVCFVPLTGQQPKAGNPPPPNSPSQSANPGTPATGNPSAPAGEADKIDEIAHRVRILASWPEMSNPTTLGCRALSRSAPSALMLRISTLGM
jgi:hypothetical protein